MMWIRLAMVLSACVLMGLTLLREDSHSGKEKEAVAHTKDAIRHIEEFVKGTGDAHAQDALQHAREAIMRAEESIMHAEMAGKQPEGKKKGE